MKKIKIQWSQVLGTVISMAVGFVCGYLLVNNHNAIPVEDSWGKLVWLLGLLLALYASTIIQMIIHEAGHLLFGSLSGYKFSSFRILSFIWIKEGQRIKLRKLTIAGTGGQCLMSPPDLKDGKIPVILYNLGGSIVNIVVSLLFLGLYFACIPLPFLASVMLIFALVGFIFGILNGIPMRLGAVDNDGYNAWALASNSEAMRAFWIQMKVNEQISQGLRLKDMPGEWFQIPSDEGLGNSMVAVIGVFACNRLMDQHRFTQADAQMAHQLQIESGMVGLHRCMMICDRIYLELIGQNRSDVLTEMLSKQQKKFMASMKNSPSVLRTQYTYALLAEKNEAKAAQLLARFEKAAASYPYPNEVAAERELIAIAQNL